MLFKSTYIVKYLIIELLLLCGVAFAACAAPPDNSPLQTAQPSQQQSAKPEASAESTPKPKISPKDLKIIVSINNMGSYSGSEFVKGIEEILKEKGVNYEVYDAKGDANLQAFQIRDLVGGDTDAIIVDATDALVVKQARDFEPELPVVFIEDFAPDSSEHAVSPIERDALSVAAKEFKQNKKSGKTMFLNVETYANQDREDAFIKALMDENIEISAYKTVPSYEEGTHTVSTWMMAYPDFKSVWTYSPEAVDSVLYVKDLAGREDICVVGVTDKQEHLQALKEGIITAVIYPLYSDIGAYAAETAIAAALNKEAPKAAQSLYRVYTRESFKNANSPIAVYPPIGNIDIKKEAVE